MQVRLKTYQRNMKDFVTGKILIFLVLQTCLKRIRLDLPILSEEFTSNEGMLVMLLVQWFKNVSSHLTN